MSAIPGFERVIKNRSTGKFYAAGGAWTSDARLAWVFEDLSRAFDTARAEGLRGCSVVVFSGSSREIDAQFPID